MQHFQCLFSILLTGFGELYICSVSLVNQIARIPPSQLILVHSSEPLSYVNEIPSFWFVRGVAAAAAAEHAAVVDFMDSIEQPTSYSPFLHFHNSGNCVMAPRVLSVQLGCLVPVIHHCYQHVEQNYVAETQERSVDDLQKPQSSFCRTISKGFFSQWFIENNFGQYVTV